MELYELLNGCLELIDVEVQATINNIYLKHWYDEDKLFYISKNNIKIYYQNIEKIYSLNDNIYTRFSRETIYKFIEDQIVKYKKNKKIFTKEISKLFFKTFEKQKAYDRYIIAPISGIRLDNVEKINISIFEIGKQSNLKFPLSNDTDGYYIAVQISNIYDDIIAIEEAENKFSDFVQLVLFISGKDDKSILIKIGLPSYQSISHEIMYIETSSYQIVKSMEENPLSNKISNVNLKKIPIDNDFFCKNENFIKIWELYKKKSSNSKDISDMEVRLINAAISVGKSAMSESIKDSIIYTSMAFEILFSLDERSLFQKSIGDKLAETLAFIVAKDKNARLETIKNTKKFYGLRSALVHGGNKKADASYIIFNQLLRLAISEIINNKKYKNIKILNDLFRMVKEAQNSY